MRKISNNQKKIMTRKLSKALEMIEDVWVIANKITYNRSMQRKLVTVRGKVNNLILDVNKE